MRKKEVIENLNKMKHCFSQVAPYYIEALEKAVAYIEKDPVAEVPCSDGLGALLIRVQELSDQFEDFACAESDDFTRGQFDGKATAYNDCSEFLKEIIKEHT